MIYIFEDAKRSLGGITSLYIGSDYNKDVINIIKASGTYAYHKENQLWEVPLTSLAFLLDNLFYYDEITLIVNDEDENKEEIKPSLEYKLKPFDYQLEGITYGLNHNKFFLLDEAGLGKTLQIIYLAEELQAKGEIEHCLIICGLASLRSNWMKEIQKCSHLSGMMVGDRINKNGRHVWDKIPKRVEQLSKPIDEFFIIINVQALRDERIIEALIKGPNKIGMMAFDECHCAKGYDSQQGLNLLELSADHQIAMSGTLLLNNPLDAYIPLVWLGFEPKCKVKGKSGITRFKNMYCVLDPSTRGRILGFKNLDILQQEIMSNAIRRKKDLLKLPPKNIIDEYLSMDDTQDDFYHVIADSVKRDSKTKEKAVELCDKIELDDSNFLSIITRLRQATTCPSFLTSKNIQSCKIERAKALAEEIVASGEKVVIFSSFKEPLNVLMNELKDLNPLLGTGDLSDQEISDNIDTFQNDDKHKVFLGTISRCGTGLTLTKASYMIFLDQPWTYAIYSQACDRIYRIGTDKPVFIYNLICENTIDAKIAEILEQKRAISDYIIDDLDDAEILSILQKFVFDLEC